MLAYGIAADCADDYLKIGVSTTLECVKTFCLAITQLFGDEYLRKPNQADVDQLLQVAEVCDFPDMLGCIDCIHWECKNYQWDGRVLFKKDFIKFQLSSFTLLHHMTLGYDMHSLVC